MFQHHVTLSHAVPNLICILLRICVCKFNRLIIVLDHFYYNSQIGLKQLYVMLHVTPFFHIERVKHW